MKKRVKAFVKVGTVVMMSTCIAFSNINASILVNAEENQGEYAFYEDNTEVIEETKIEESTESTEEETTEPEETTETEEPETTETTEQPEQTETEETEETEETTEPDEEETESEETESEETEETILVQTELNQTLNNTTISISGNLPKDIELVVTELEDDRGIKNSIEETLTGNATVTVYKSFDITLMLKGEEYEPESDNNSVVVTIKCEDSIEDNSAVFHTDNNNNTTEISSTINAETNTVEFSTESFSVYTIASVTYDTDTGIEYSNTYGTGYYFIDSKTLLVTSAGTATTSNNRDYPWYEINENIEKVIIKSDVGSIGNYEFSGYRNLKGVIIEEGVTSIGRQAFSGCSSLSHLVIPSSVTYISDQGVFDNCTSLTSASPISENKGTGYEYGWADTIPANAFCGLRKLQTASIPDTITNIGRQAFRACSSLQEVIIPDGVTKIEGYTFTDCSLLNHLVIPSSVTYINDQGVLDGCSSLTSASPISEGKGTGYEYGWTETIPANAFCGLRKLQTVSILNTITTIGGSIFSECSSLQEIIIPDGVTKIEEYTFNKCSSLNHLVVPSSVMSISGRYTFSGCDSLVSASPLSENKGTGYEYGWTDTIPTQAFADLGKLQTVSILDTITTIEYEAFRLCYSLQEVIIPDSVNTIGYRAFANCNKLITFKIGKGIKTIDSDAFRLSRSTDTTVYTDNKVVKKYNWSGDNRNVTFMRLNPITDLDIVIPVNNMSFNIDSEKNFSSDKVKIVNNSPCDVDIFVKNINGENNTVSIVPENTYTDEEWKALTDFNSIAFMINNTDLAVAYNNSENDESKFINLGKLKSVENEDEVDPSGYTFTTYSASTAKANGRASISSGKAGYVGNGADNYVYWTINVDKTGKYCFGVNGAVSGTRTTYIDANGVNVGSVTHQGSSWSTGFDVYTTVELQAGENIIKLYNNSGYAPDIYNIQLSNEFVTDNTFDLQLEAKYPKSYEIDTDLEMNYNLTLLFVSKEN